MEGKRDRENVSTCEHGYYRQRRNKDDEKHEDFMEMQETQRRANANNKTNKIVSLLMAKYRVEYYSPS